jgi:hypothetical protein
MAVRGAPALSADHPPIDGSYIQHTDDVCLCLLPSADLQTGRPVLQDGRPAYKHEMAPLFLFYSSFVSSWCIGLELGTIANCFAMVIDDVCQHGYL